MSTVAERIKFVRKHFHLNQIEFAGFIGISQTHISKIESERDNASDKVLLAICSEFNINFDWLKNGVGTMETQDEPSRNPSDIALKLKKYLMSCSAIESDLCSMFLLGVPDLFHCGSDRPDKYRSDIVLQISDLLENVIKLNKCLDEETKLIASSDNPKEHIDGAFWLRDNYEKRIRGNIENLLNLYLGSASE